MMWNALKAQFNFFVSYVFNKCICLMTEPEEFHDNMVAFNSDNCNVMKGRHNLVITKLKAKQPHIQDVGCVCHLAQLATGWGMKASVEHLLVGVYSHFDKRYVLKKEKYV